jgi:hypothetical protein
VDNIYVTLEMFLGSVGCGEKRPNVELDHSFSTVTKKNVKPDRWSADAIQLREPTIIDGEEHAWRRKFYKTIGARFALQLQYNNWSFAERFQ